MSQDTYALTEEELAEARAYMRVDEGPEAVLDDAQVERVVRSCVRAARAYLAGAGVSLPPAGTNRRAEYDVVCHALALARYDTRNALSESALLENPVFRRMLNQLKMTEPPVSNLDTGGEEG